MDAAQALADLTEISAQIEFAVLADASGSVLASTYSEPSRGDELARAAVELVAAAGETPDGGQELVQIQAATPRGSVFVVRSSGHVVAAITGAKPTVGLIFYDLKTCLRMLEREAAKAEQKKAKKEAAPKETAPDEAAPKETKVGKASGTRRASAAKKKEEAGEGT